jgi:hypothetical protein
VVGCAKIVKTVRIPRLLLKGSLEGIRRSKIVALLIEAHAFVGIRLHKSAAATEQAKTNHADQRNTEPHSTKQKPAVSQCIVLHLYPENYHR